MRRSSASALAVVALASLVASVASAQEDCAPGGDAEGCVVRAPEPAGAASLVTELAPPPAPADHGIAEWPHAPRDLLAAVVEPRLRPVRRVDDGLLAAGVTTFALGYLAGVVVGIIEATGWQCSRGGCDTWPLAAIPLVGGVLAGTVELDGRSRYTEGWGWGLGLPGLALQAVGLVMVVTSVLHTSEEVVGASEARLSIAPMAGLGTAGLSMTLEL